MTQSHHKDDDEAQRTPFPTKHHHPDPTKSQSVKPQKKQLSEEQRLDEGLDETFPASDPVSIGTSQTKKSH